MTLNGFCNDIVSSLGSSAQRCNKKTDTQKLYELHKYTLKINQKFWEHAIFRLYDILKQSDGMTEEFKFPLKDVLRTSFVLRKVQRPLYYLSVYFSEILCCILN